MRLRFDNYTAGTNSPNVFPVSRRVRGSRTGDMAFDTLGLVLGLGRLMMCNTVMDRLADYETACNTVRTG